MRKDRVNPLLSRGVDSRATVDMCSMQNRGSELRHNHVVPALTVFFLSCFALFFFSGRYLYLFCLHVTGMRGDKYSEKV